MRSSPSMNVLALRESLPTVSGGRLPEDASAEELKRLLRCSTAEARSRIPFEQAEKLGILPLSVQRGREGDPLLLALGSEAPGPVLLSELRFLAGMPVALEVFESKALLVAAIPAAYRGDATALSTAAQRAKCELLSRAESSRRLSEAVIDRKAPVPQLLEAIVVRAHYLAASDVHLEPQGNGVRLRFRVDGLLREETAVALSFQALDTLARHIKVLCNLDLTEKRRPQDGSFSVELREGRVRIRVSFLPQHDTERIVMRVLCDARAHEGEASRSTGYLSGLGLDRDQERTMLAHLSLSGGSLLFAGPTGSGKTTMLYACLQHLNEEWRSVVTIEDPIERMLEGINQTQVTPHLGFGQFLPVLLRQDPDVVMVGEIRDPETAETALTAGITGHLVLSTVHAGSCFEILPRLQYLGVSGLLLGASLKLLIAQRLLPKNCLECVREVRCNASLARFFQLAADTTLRDSPGCVACGGTGVCGRRGVFELLPISPALQDLLLKCASREQAGVLLQSVKRQAREEGFLPLAFRVRDILVEGIISPTAACRGLGLEPRLFE